MPLGVDRDAVGLVRDHEEEVVDQEPQITRRPLARAIERQPLRALDDDVGGALEHVADGSRRATTPVATPVAV